MTISWKIVCFQAYHPSTLVNVTLKCPIVVGTKLSFQSMLALVVLYGFMSNFLKTYEKLR